MCLRGRYLLECSLGMEALVNTCFIFSHFYLFYLAALMLVEAISDTLHLVCQHHSPHLAFFCKLTLTNGPPSPKTIPSGPLPCWCWCPPQPALHPTTPGRQPQLELELLPSSPVLRDQPLNSKIPTIVQRDLAASHTTGLSCPRA